MIQIECIAPPEGMSKEAWSQRTGFKVTTIEGWMKRHWQEGKEYSVTGNGAVRINTREAERFLKHGSDRKIEAKAKRQYQELPAELYRYFDKNGKLLYVGISLSTISRAAQHRMSAVWWGQAVRIEIERFDSRDSAAEAEAEAIKTESPIYNKYHSLGDHQ